MSDPRHRQRSAGERASGLFAPGVLTATLIIVGGIALLCAAQALRGVLGVVALGSGLVLVVVGAMQAPRRR
ncbi:MAG: hypothetical protein M5U28_46035 [Sandaracinaceae bacterium]|nr:hypothetical protein [Sandaracinaceae bacterium]